MPHDTIQNPELPPLHVTITREPFSDYFVLILDSGDSEELEVEDTRDWFRQRGANMDAIEKALDQTWNFYRSEVIISKPKNPPEMNHPYAPQV